MLMSEKRQAIVDYGKRLVSSGLSHGTGGNLSVFDRDEGLMAVTPSGVRYEEVEASAVVVTDPGGQVVEGSLKPSSELAFHAALYRRFADIQAVVHTHSVYATTLACLRWEIPAVHYLVGFAGQKVPLAPYATYGTRELADHIVTAMDGYRAVLLANHGLVAMGENLEQAFSVAEEAEFCARVYYQCKGIGDPVILPEDEMTRVMEKFKTYGPAAQEAE